MFPPSRQAILAPGAAASRGPIVDQGALHRHLVEHPGFSAGLDVWGDQPSPDDRLRVGHPFLALASVLGSPHNSGVVPGWPDLGVERAAENQLRYLLGDPVVGLERREDHAV